MTPVSGITTEGNFRLCCLPARHYNIGKLSEFIISEARQKGAGENKLLELELVLEELLTNIVEHGYRDMSAIEPWFRAGIDASLCDILRLRIEDAGLPFDTSRRPDTRPE
jgi:anti-sigma regulatory factor (Ser/Thr protein kinase)